jgi:DNA (cytosine-5)-methyltransferase 1
MSWGLHLAGFQVAGAVDNWSIALKTLQRNHPGAQVFDGDIRNLSVDSVMESIDVKVGELDVIVGGPPCQGFSKNVPAAYRFLEDDRNQLFHEYLRFVEGVRPRVVVMENVAEIFNAYGGAVTHEITERLASMGYSTSVRVVTAADHGVPQNRRRCIFIASRTGVEPKFPDSTHEQHSGSRRLFDVTQPWVSAWEAIRDLPRPMNSAADDAARHETPPDPGFQSWVRNGAKAVVNHEYARLRPKQIERYKSIGPGQGLKDLPDHLKTKGGYSGAYGRLDFESVAPTITRWVFHPGSGRYGHPAEPRIITMREAARLQSFTDDFVFEGSRNQIAGQIGNAVPPLLMYSLAEEVSRLVAG